MSLFRTRLANLAATSKPERWLFVAFDQLSATLGPLRAAAGGRTGIIMCETTWRPKQRAYHQQKLALVLANQRQFAIEQASRGVPVRYLMGTDDYATMLRAEGLKVGPIEVMEPAERELRTNLEPLIEGGHIRPIANPFWLSSEADFHESQGERWRWRMDRFYRHMRLKKNLLIDEAGKPLGGKWSHDAANRKRWPGTPTAPTRPVFEHDEIDQEVFALVRDRFGHHPGRLTPETLPTTQAHAEALWAFALEQCLANFGAFEDAMTVTDPHLFHTNISQVLNLGRLSAARIVEDVAELDAPLNSQEGFIRQVLGWREFVRHVHRETDGFRQIDERAQVAPEPGAFQSQEAPSFLGSEEPLPPAFWGQDSGLKCLDHVVEEVWDHGYTHHINRLMVLANWATLLDVSPRALSDWFWVAFIDAFDWVVEPNVIGMGTFGVGELMTTKPYISGSGYLNKMGDYCKSCQFSAGKTCPMTPMYWAFLNRHRPKLAGNVRLALPLASAAKRTDDRQLEDERIARLVMTRLREGNAIGPQDFEVGPTHG